MMLKSGVGGLAFGVLEKNEDPVDLLLSSADGACVGADRDITDWR